MIRTGGLARISAAHDMIVDDYVLRFDDRGHKLPGSRLNSTLRIFADRFSYPPWARTTP